MKVCSTSSQYQNCKVIYDPSQLGKLCRGRREPFSAGIRVGFRSAPRERTNPPPPSGSIIAWLNRHLELLDRIEEHVFQKVPGEDHRAALRDQAAGTPYSHARTHSLPWHKKQKHTGQSNYHYTYWHGRNETVRIANVHSGACALNRNCMRMRSP